MEDYKLSTYSPLMCLSVILFFSMSYRSPEVDFDVRFEMNPNMQLSDSSQLEAAAEPSSGLGH
jgi:hypothetical protein